MSTPLSQSPTFQQIVDEQDAKIQDQLSNVNNAARLDLTVQYTFNQDGTISAAISALQVVQGSQSTVLGEVTRPGA